MNELLHGAFAICGFAAGWYAERAARRAVRVLRRWRIGACSHYVATGRIEWRAGTLSDFCQRCGHARGTHD